MKKMFYIEFETNPPQSILRGTVAPVSGFVKQNFTLFLPEAVLPVNMIKKVLGNLSSITLSKDIEWDVHEVDNRIPTSVVTNTPFNKLVEISRKIIAAVLTNYDNREHNQ